MKMPTQHRGLGGGGIFHFHLPFQFFLGLIFMAFGGLLLLKKMGTDYIPFIPEQVLIIICAIGSLLGGFYLVVSRILRPRMVFSG